MGKRKLQPGKRQFYSAGEVAEMVGLHRRTITRLIRDHHIPAMQFYPGGAQLVPAAWVHSLPAETVQHWIEVEHGPEQLDVGGAAAPLDSPPPPARARSDSES